MQNNSQQMCRSRTVLTDRCSRASMSPRKRLMLRPHALHATKVQTHSLYECFSLLTSHNFLKETSVSRSSCPIKALERSALSKHVASVSAGLVFSVNSCAQFTELKVFRASPCLQTEPFPFPFSCGVKPLFSFQTSTHSTLKIRSDSFIL